MVKRKLPALPVVTGRGHNARTVTQRLISRGLVSSVMKIPPASDKKRSPWTIAKIAPEAGRYTQALKNLALIVPAGRVEGDRTNSPRKLWAGGPNLSVVQEYIRSEGLI